MDNTAQTAQIHRETPIFMQEYCSTPLGDTKIPAPIILISKKHVTQRYPSSLLSCIFFSIPIIIKKF
jgi:hypothetical protein